MNKKIKQFMAGAGFIFAASSAQAQITCTAAPDCASLGYNKTAAQCPSGGVKCPFNSSLMFCLKNTSAYNFQLTVPTAFNNVVYHDGSNSASYTYNANKTPIGVVAHVYKNSGNTHGYITTLDQPVHGTYAEAIEYCNNYVVKGTNVGDWRLPDAMEMMNMGSVQSLGTSTTPYNDLNTKLLTIRRGEILGTSCSTTSGYSNSCTTITDHWTTNDYYSSPTTHAYALRITSYNYLRNETKATSRHFRCIMDF